MFLYKIDFSRSIRLPKLDEVTGGDDAIIDVVVLDVVEEMSSYFRDRYDVSQIFTDIQLYDLSTAFIADSYVILLANDYSTTTDYAVNAFTATTDGKVWKSIQTPNIDKSPETEPTYWTEWGKNGAIYKNLLGTAGANLLDPTEYTFGDPRDPLIKRYAIDISLFELHKLINPRNIPEFRTMAREDALRWLKHVSDPRNNIIPNLPENPQLDQSGFDIVYGSSDSQEHEY